MSHDIKDYAVIGVQGLTRPHTIINTATGGGLDGSFFNSSRIETRNIVITIVLNGDIERNRQELYRIFPAKTMCTVYFKNENRNVKINGYVETLQADLFSKREQVQISILCPRPFWEDMNLIYAELSKIVSLFEFPFSIAESPGVPLSEIADVPACTINNIGDIKCGCKITIDVTGTIENIKIFDLRHQSYFGLNYVFHDGDKVVIDTISGEMSVNLEQSGIMTNILNYVMSGSHWFRLEPGDNTFTLSADSGIDNAAVSFEVGVLYGGV